MPRVLPSYHMGRCPAQKYMLSLPPVSPSIPVSLHVSRMILTGVTFTIKPTSTHNLLYNHHHPSYIHCPKRSWYTCSQDNCHRHLLLTPLQMLSQDNNKNLNKCYHMHNTLPELGHRVRGCKLRRVDSKKQ